MTTFIDGPAANVVLKLERSPLFLRVVHCHEQKSLLEKVLKVDALDQLNDTPESHETVVVYRLTGKAGVAYIDGRDPKTGRRYGQRLAIARYKLCEVQPAEEVLRDTSKWQEWCRAMAAEAKD